MIRKTQGWTPKTMAATLGIHPNTIRMYERLGFIATPARRPNGYRVLTDVHLAQLRICRTIFGCPYANRAIRDAGTRLVQASAQCNLPACRQAAQAYGQAIREEIEKAEQTRALLTAWLVQPPEAERFPLEVLLGKVVGEEILWGLVAAGAWWWWPGGCIG
jgi:DNA-binding transcriptional MerR regulator